MAEKQQGIIDPPLDELLEHVDSKYELVIFASRRARQINDYYADLHDGAIYDNVGPLVDSAIDDKPLSIALREINAQKLVMREQAAMPSPDDVIDLDAAFSLDGDVAPGATVTPADAADSAADDESAASDVDAAGDAK